MDLTLIKNFFQATGEVQAHLAAQWPKLEEDTAFILYKAIALKSQPIIDAVLIEDFLKQFNWQVGHVSCNEVHPSGNYEIKTLLPEMTPQKLLTFGIQLLVKQWGKDNGINFSQFCQLVKGKEENPDSRQKELPFASKKYLFDLIISEINGLLKIEAYKKAVYHQYGNKTDLFEMLTPTNTFDQDQLKMLFLSQSDRKSDPEISDMSKRAKLPWNFNQFLEEFKTAAKKNNEKQYKIHYSSKKNKGDSTPDHRAFTTPRKSKAMHGYSSTKLTKGEVIEELVHSSREVSEFSEAGSKSKENHYVEILAQVLQVEEDFINESASLIKREDFDLELVYERHGKKFQKILNKRYGICNYSAFVRFIVPRDYEHRYLSFIRYQANNKLSSETEEKIDQLLEKHEKKEEKIKQIWNQCDIELLQRAFCKPSEQNMKTEKLRDYFTKRETAILIDRLDPCKKGNISVADLR